MREKYSKFLTLIFLTLSLCAPRLVFAETVYLKSGKTIEGKIIEKTDKYVKIDFQGAPLTYFNDEIEHIEGGDISARTPQGQKENMVGIFDVEKKENPLSKDFSSPQEATKHYEAILKNDPNSFEAHWNLASLYLSGGFGPQAVSHIEKAMSINKQKAIQGGAYIMLTMAYYYAGEFKNSYAVAEEALKANPKDQAALGLKNMLDTVAKRYYNGELPDKTSWYGYESSGEMLQAKLKKGVGFLSSKEDGITFDFAQFYFMPPPGWSKKANDPHETGVSFLFYSRDPDYPLPSIGVTRDSPGEGIYQAIDFTRQVRKMMLSMAPGITIIEPQTVTIAGYTASTFDMRDEKNKVRSYWYQFLIENNIISLQLMTKSDTFEQDFIDFKKFAESMRVMKNPPRSE